MISQTAEYALRAMVFLAEQDRALTIGAIASVTQVPQGYLSKVMQNLAKSGLVVSQRGLGGGFSLARPSEEITVFDILQAVDPISRITRCPLDNPAHKHNLCGLHRRLDDAAAHLERTFRECSLAELNAQPTFTTV